VGAARAALHGPRADRSKQKPQTPQAFLRPSPSAAHLVRYPSHSFKMPRFKNQMASSKLSVSHIDKQMEDIANQIAALSARQEKAIKEMERAAAEVAFRSQDHDRLAHELARAEAEKNRFWPSNPAIQRISRSLLQSFCRS
jgi:hypothetical protein